MTLSLFVLAAMWGHYRALTVLFSGSDILRLRTMMTLALAFSAMCVAVEPGSIGATVTALAACRLHPDLRLRPLVPCLLLMLTPAWALSAILAAAFGNSVFALNPDSWAWMQATALLVLGLAALCLPWPGLRWQRRLLSLSMCVSIAAAAISQDPVLWTMLAVAGFAAGWRCGLCGGLTNLSHALRPLSAIALAFGLALAASAGPWTQREGEELVIVRAPVSRQSNADGALSVQIYSEAGVSDDLSFVSSGYQEMAGERTRVGGSAGLRVALWREEDWIFSSEASAGIQPFSLADSGGWKRHAQGDIKLLAGWSGSLDDLPVYASGVAVSSGAIRRRNGPGRLCGDRFAPRRSDQCPRVSYPRPQRR